MVICVVSKTTRRWTRCIIYKVQRHSTSHFFFTLMSAAVSVLLFGVYADWLIIHWDCSQTLYWLICLKTTFSINFETHFLTQAFNWPTHYNPGMASSGLKKWMLDPKVLTRIEPIIIFVKIFTYFGNLGFKKSANLLHNFWVESQDGKGLPVLFKRVFSLRNALSIRIS